MFSTTEKMLGSVLEKLCDELDLPPSKYKDAIAKYEAVGIYLADIKSGLYKYNPRIYAQGSFRLGTVVKPLQGDEYDIDLVCELQSRDILNPKALYNLIGDELKKQSDYNKRIESKTRCWRLKYANEFHLDILPAIPDDTKADESIKIPDKELNDWCFSNPKDFVKWFYKQMETNRTQLIKEAKLDIEKVPFYQFKTPLQKTIQILKRHRDIMFKNNPDDKPISIIITTLAAKAYHNESNTYEALINIIENMPKKIERINNKAVVLNPTNLKENFADKWSSNPKKEKNFYDWLIKAKSVLTESLKNDDLKHIREILSPAFGENLIAKSIYSFERDRIISSGASLLSATTSKEIKTELPNKVPNPKREGFAF